MEVLGFNLGTLSGLIDNAVLIALVYGCYKVLNIDLDWKL